MADPDNTSIEADAETEADAKPRRPRWRKKRYRITAALLVISLIVNGPWPADNSHYEGSDYQASTLARLEATPVVIGNAGPLLVSTAEVDITPPAGHPLAGFARWDFASASVSTNLFARAITLRRGEAAVTILAAELLIIDRALADAVLAEADLQPGDIYFTATHTHSGPGGWGDHLLQETAMGDYDPDYFKKLAGQLADAVRQSREAVGIPCEAAVVQVETTGRQKNRIDPDAPTYDTLTAISFRPVSPGSAPTTRPGDPLAIVAVFSAHPTACGLKARAIDGDYPGALCRRLTERGVVAPAFAAGAVADHRPKAPWTSTDKIERAHSLGRQLADRIMDTLPSAEYRADVDLVSLQLDADLMPLRVPVSSGWRWSPIVTSWIHAPSTRLQVLRVGSTVLASLPADSTSELAMQMDEWGRQRGLTVVRTDFGGDYIGYLVAREQFEKHWAYETRILNFFGPWAGPYLNSISQRMIERTVEP